VRVLLFQVDGKFPNLALMRLARYHRDRSDSVFLTRSIGDTRFDKFDRVYSSSIFTFSEDRRKKFFEVHPDAIVGGDGYKPIWSDLTVIGRNLGSNLREVITDVNPDEIVPDYSDYPQFANSIGYSQRGCRLDCGFCRMKTREGEARKVNSIVSVWRGDPWPKHIVLLDNDFFGQKEWREQLQEAKRGSFKICFNQGINIRLVNEEQARELAGVFYCDDQFKTKRLYTAWDNLGDERIFKLGVETLKRSGIPPKDLMVYMLFGFRKGETMEEVFYRFSECVALGCKPYPMVFDRSNRELVRFQRWVIGRFYEYRESRGGPVVPWEIFRKGGPRNFGYDSGQSAMFESDVEEESA
jgi:hypothetical protein